MVFRRDDQNGDEVEEKISQFRRQLDTLNEDDREPWDDAEAMDWPDQAVDPPAPQFAGEPETESAPVRRASVVASEASWSGTLQSDGPITIYGEFYGDIIAGAEVHIAAGANVQAQIQAVDLEVAGALEGSIHCSNKFVVLESGNVQGKVVAPIIVVHDGASVEGQFLMQEDEQAISQEDET